jgi:hypothetical protein
MSFQVRLERLYSVLAVCGGWRLPNNSFNASGISMDVIRKVECFSQFFPPRQFGRYAPRVLTELKT